MNKILNNYFVKIWVLLSIFTLSACSILTHHKKTQMVINGITNQAVLAGNKNFSWFDEEYKSYQPNQVIIDQLKPLKNEINVLVIAGTWCGDTQRELPRFFKIANEIGIPNNHIEMIMVDENKKTDAFNISVLQVTNIPTFIFFKNGKETGRIIEKTVGSMEEDLVKLVH